MKQHLPEGDDTARRSGHQTPKLAEAELVRLAKARSPEAWTQIYQTHYRTIYRYTRARVFDETTAEDLTSAVFEGALKGIRTYQYRGRPLLAWLYRIARNTVASHQRQLLGVPPADEGRGSFRRGLRRVLPWSRPQAARTMGDDLASVADSAGDPGTMLDRLDLRDALETLPASQQEVLILRFFAGLSAAEVGEAIGKGPAAVYSLQARAILALRKQLGQQARGGRSGDE